MAASDPIRIELPVELRSVANRRDHPLAAAGRAASERRTAELVTAAALRSSPDLRWAPRLLVTIHRAASRSVALDGDNLARAAKHVRDGIARALRLDDGDPRLVWRYAQSKPAARAERGRTFVLIEPAGAGEFDGVSDVVMRWGWTPTRVGPSGGAR